MNDEQKKIMDVLQSLCNAITCDIYDRIDPLNNDSYSREFRESCFESMQELKNYYLELEEAERRQFERRYDI